MTSDLANLRGSGGPHSRTSQRKITSERTGTPPELAENGDKTTPPRNKDVSRYWDNDAASSPLICRPIQTSDIFTLESKRHEEYEGIKP